MRAKPNERHKKADAPTRPLFRYLLFVDLLADRDGLDFDEDVLRKAADLDAGARGGVFGEVLRVDGGLL